jgi:hypothetical protein
MNFYFEIALPLLGTVQIPVSLVLGTMAFTLGMFFVVAIMIGIEIDNRRAQK